MHEASVAVRRKNLREVADDSMNAAEEIAFRDTTRAPREIEFQSEKQSRAFPSRSASATQGLFFFLFFYFFFQLADLLSIASTQRPLLDQTQLS